MVYFLNYIPSLAGKVPRRVDPFIIGFGFLVLMLLIAPWWNVYELGRDEGINLQKANLLSQGFSLYSEIWSDQPPFLTIVLGLVNWVFPYSVTAGRVTVLIFALMLVVALYLAVRNASGRLAGWLSVILLISSPMFIKLSVSVMIGLPSIALAAVSLVLGQSTSRRALTAGLSGCVLALAISTKISAALILPAVLIAIVQASDHRPLRSLGTFFAWLCTTLVLLLGLGSDFAFAQLVSPHLTAFSVEIQSLIGGPHALKELVRQRAPLLFWGFILFFPFLLVRRPAWQNIYPALAWIILCGIVFSLHRPLWSHHALILMPPLAWLVASWVAPILSREVSDLRAHRFQHLLKGRHLTLASAIMLGGLIAAVTITGVDRARKGFLRQPSFEAKRADIWFELNRQSSKRAIADRPMFAYRAGLSVPPALAVWSRKRMLTGRLTEDQIYSEILNAPDAVILLSRFAYSDGFLSKIAVMRQLNPAAFTLPNFRFKRKLLALAEQTAPATALRYHLKMLQSDTILGGVWKNGFHFARPSDSQPLEPGSVVIRPPGSAPELGACLLASSRAYDSPTLLAEATRFGEAISCAQTPQGGWPRIGHLSPGCRTQRTKKTTISFDDGLFGAALQFSMDLQQVLTKGGAEPPAWLTRTIESALDFVVAAQFDTGGWPQDVGSKKFNGLATLNDDVTPGLIRLLLRVHAQDPQRALLHAAIRGGDFLLRVQSADGAFAQQYDHLDQPAAARKFEPAAWASLETGFAINALLDLHIATQDRKYRDAAERAANWLQNSQIAPGVWARFQSLDGSGPLFEDRSGKIVRSLEDLPADERDSYRWIGDRHGFPELGYALDRITALAQGIEALQAVDQQWRSSALLADNATARAPFLSLGAKASLPADFPMTRSARSFVKYCAAALSPPAGNP